MKIPILFVFILMTPGSYACGCDATIGLKESKVVFKGKVESITRIEDPFIRYEIKFKIQSWTKGRRKGKFIIINTPCLLGACCGIAFQKGEVYKVYSYVDDAQLYTNYCTATKKIT